MKTIFTIIILTFIIWQNSQGQTSDKKEKFNYFYKKGVSEYHSIYSNYDIALNLFQKALNVDTTNYLARYYYGASMIHLGMAGYDKKDADLILKGINYLNSIGILNDSIYWPINNNIIDGEIQYIGKYKDHKIKYGTKKQAIDFILDAYNRIEKMNTYNRPTLYHSSFEEMDFDKRHKRIKELYDHYRFEGDSDLN